MRAIFMLSALVLSAGASAAPPRLSPSLPLNAEAIAGASQQKFDSASATKGSSTANCRGRIETARAELGLPKLQKDDAKPDAPLLIAALDKTIDGCEVLVMRDNLSDIRPLPEFKEGSGKLMPLGRQ